MRRTSILLLTLVLASAAVGKQQIATRFDYLRTNQALIYAGMQALFTCNGLFVSNRTLDQLNGAELKMDQMPLAPPDEVKIDLQRKTVLVGEHGNGPAPPMRA